MKSGLHFLNNILSLTTKSIEIYTKVKPVYTNIKPIINKLSSIKLITNTSNSSLSPIYTKENENTIKFFNTKKP